MEISDLSTLKQLEIDAFQWPFAHNRFNEDIRERWSLNQLLNLCSLTKGTVEHLKFLNPAFPSFSDSGETLLDVFRRVGSLKSLALSVELLDCNDFDKSCQCSDQLQSMANDGVMGQLKEVSLFFHRNAEVRHADYVNFFLQMCPKLCFVLLDCNGHWPVIEGELIQAIMALQLQFSPIEIVMIYPKN